MKNYFLIVLFCLPDYFSIAQNFVDQDSLRQVILTSDSDTIRVNAYYQLSNISLRKDHNLTAARLYADSAFSLAQHVEYDKGEASAHFMLGLLDRLEGNYISALNHFDKNIAYFEHDKNPLTLPAALFQVAVIHRLLGSYDKSLDIYYRILRIYEDEGDQYAEASVLNSIGNIYAAQKKNELSLEYFYKSLDLFYQLNEKRDQANTLSNIGGIYNAMQNYDSAQAILSRSLAISNEINYDDGKAEVLEKLGFISSERGDYEKALQLYSQALSISRSLNDQRTTALNLSNIGRVYLKMSVTDKGMVNLHEALDIAKTIGARDLRMDINKSLSEAYADRNDFKNALLYHRTYEVVKDSILSEESTKHINQLQIQYETERKEAEIVLLNKERDFQNAELEKEQRTRWFLTVSAVLLVLMIFSLVLYYRQKMKNRELTMQRDAEINRRKLEELEKNQKLYALDAMITGQEVERRRIAQDLHDGLGVLLSSVQMQFSAVQEEIDKLQRLDVYRKANEMLDEACSEVRKIAHNMMPGTLLKLGLIPALKDMCERIETSSTTQVEFHSFGLEKRLTEVMEITVYRLVQEALNNIVKHAAATEVLIQLSKNEEHLTVTIEDNGKGFNVVEAKEKEGMGLKNMESRVKYLNGELTIESQPGNGTTVNIDIPVHDANE